MRIQLGICLLYLTAVPIFALSGTVKDTQGGAIAGAVISIVSDTSLHTKTDANGAFAINKSVTIFTSGKSGYAYQSLTHISIQGESLRFSMGSPASSGSTTIYRHDGSKLYSTTLGQLSLGQQQVSIPKLTPGLYFLRITLDDFSNMVSLVQTGDAIFIRDPLTSGQVAPVLRRQASGSAVAETLVVEKAGYATAKSPFTSFDQSGLSIVLNPAPDTSSPLPPITDYTANGPYTAVVEANVGPGGSYTVFRPEPMGQNGFLHAPIIYGHGIGGQVSGFTNFLKNVASHGFVIIGCNILNGGPNSAENNTAMTNGLNWILEQNTVANSKYFGKLAVNKAASMGYSVGGTAAVDIGDHKAILTVVSIHGHISKTVLHGTLLQTSGTKDNVGLPMQQQTFANSKVPTFLGTVTNADHGYIQQNNGGAERPAIVAWLRYRIYNDTGAKKYFYGTDCIMCAAPWENPQRKNWQ